MWIINRKMVDLDMLIYFKISKYKTRYEVETKPRHQLLMQSHIYTLRTFTIPEMGLHDRSNHFFDWLCFTYPETQVNCNGFPNKTMQVDGMLNRLQNLPQVIHSHSGYFLLLSATHFQKLLKDTEAQKRNSINILKASLG